MNKVIAPWVIRMIMNAVNASSPVGLGWLHFDDNDYTEEDIYLRIRDSYVHGQKYYIDYFDGRCVKLRFSVDDGVCSFLDDEPDPEYQTWCNKYPTYEALYQSALEENDVTS